MKIWRCFFLIGLLITLLGLTFNLSQQKDYQCVAVEKKSTSNIVTDEDGKLFQMPFTYLLEDIISENYPSGRAKSHTAMLICCYQNVTDTLRISENHPAKYFQYNILLQNIGRTTSYEDFAEFLITESKAETFVHIGLVLLTLCSLGWLVFRFSFGRSIGRWILLILLIILVVVIILVLNPMLQSREVPPILRSVWFIPHVVSYILAYALLISGWFTSIYALCKPSSSKPQHSISMLESGTAFYTIGLALGIIWAKSAWGSFWNWDPKETMALIAYGYCLSAAFILRQKNNSNVLNLILQSIGIILVIICWLRPQLLFGNLESLHSY